MIVEERDYEEVAAEAYAEMEAEKSGIVTPKKEEPKPEPEGESKGEIQEPDPNTPNIEVVEGEETSEDEKTGEEDPKPEEEGETKPETEESKDADSVITAHAEKQGMSYSEAKEDLEKTEKIIEQFKNDPKEMARALRSKDREYDKLKNEINKENKEKPVAFKKLSEDQFRNTAQSQIEQDPDKFLNGFKAKYPAKSELMSDEAIIEEMIDREWVIYQSYSTKKEAELSKKAIETRDSIISSVAKEDRRFIPEIKAYLEKLTDQDILEDGFDSSYLIYLAKGKSFDKEIKEAEERGYKRASEGAKILGVKGESGKQGPASRSTSGGSLNEKQKHRAEEMFSVDDGYTPEKAHEMFKDTFKKELKEDPNYI